MNRNNLAYKQGILSIITNLLLFGLKYWAGIVSGSIALLADAWHTLTDSFSSLVVIISVRLSAKEPDKEHPFGHGRWEEIASFLIAFFLGLIAFSFLKQSIAKFKAHESAEFGIIAIVVTIISLLAKEGLAQYAFYVSRKTNNPTIKADGWHHRSDAYSSLIVLAGIFLGKYFWWIDSLLGFLISILLFYAVFIIFKESVNKILGETPSKELISDINEIVDSVESNDIYPHHFHLHNYGTHKELTFHVKFEGDITLYKAHSIVSEIEKRIYQKLNIVSTIHIEPKNVMHELD